MELDTIVDVHPERIDAVEEVDEILHKLFDYEKKTGHKGVVVLKQNMQLGGSYRVVSEEDANHGIRTRGTCEWYIKFYPHSYFEELKKRLNAS